MTAQQRFKICKMCEHSKHDGFGCQFYKRCCFGKWRAMPSSECPQGKWKAQSKGE
jgi:hypothetical protein